MASVQGIAGGIVALLLVVIMVGVVATPLITDISNGSPFEGDNEDPALRFSYKQASEITASITMVSSGGNLTIGSVDYPNSAMGGPHISVMTDKFFVRSSAAANLFVDFDANTVTNTSSTALTLTVGSGGTYTVTSGNDTIKSGTFSWILYPDENGSWGRFATAGTMVSPDQNFIICYDLMNRSGDKPYSFLGFVRNGQLTYVKEPFTEGASTLTPVEGVVTTVSMSEVGSSQMVYRMDGWHQTKDDWTSFTTGVCYAPIHYASAITSDSDQMTATQAMMISLVPTLLCIVAVVVGAKMIANRE